MKFLQNGETLSSVERRQSSIKATKDLHGRSPVLRHRCYLPGTSATTDKSSCSMLFVPL